MVKIPGFFFLFLDDRYEIQESVFFRWANYLLEEQQQQFVVNDLKDLSDIRFLTTFGSIITGQQFVRVFFLIMHKRSIY